MEEVSFWGSTLLVRWSVPPLLRFCFIDLSVGALFLLLIFPELSSSTKEAYALVDEYLMKKDKVKGPCLLELEDIYRSDVKTWNLVNTFTPALSKKYKEIDAALMDLKKVGSEYVEMTGSGSTVFGVYTLEQQAISSYNLLAEFWNCKIARVV